MSADPWSRLAAPFPATALAWHAVNGEEDGSRLRLCPHLPSACLRERLDAVVGPAAWSLTLVPWGDDGLVAALTVAGATRSAAVRTWSRRRGGTAAGAGGAPDAAEASEVAFAAAAEGFGMLPTLERSDDGWVDADPETGEALFLPGTRPRAADPRPVAPAAGPAGDGGGSPGSAPAGSDGAPAAEPEAAGDGTGAAAPEGSAPPQEERPEGHRVIDRLVERLREEGLGAAAAKLVTSYGGYGKDHEQSRELYARLRALLVERGTRA